MDIENSVFFIAHFIDVEDKLQCVINVCANSDSIVGNYTIQNYSSTLQLPFAQKFNDNIMHLLITILNSDYKTFGAETIKTIIIMSTVSDFV